VAESGLDKPDASPPVFTKFASRIIGPRAKITLPGRNPQRWLAPGDVLTLI
jgi:hypothetical protein